MKKEYRIISKFIGNCKTRKQSARVTELAVRRFEAEVLKTQSRQYYIMQQITETENRINFWWEDFRKQLRENSNGFTRLSN